MLLAAHGKGLQTVKDAWCDYLENPDNHFDLSNLDSQLSAPLMELKTRGLESDTIQTALGKLGIPVPSVDRIPW